MELVEDHCPDAGQGRIPLQGSRQNALGHDLDPGLAGHLCLTANPVSDRLPDLFTECRGHPLRGCAGRDPAWLQHHNPSGGQTRVEQGQRHARRLAGTRRRLQHRLPPRAKGGNEVRQGVVYWESVHPQPILRTATTGKEADPLSGQRPAVRAGSAPMTTPTAELAERIRQGDRRALARAITLVESGRADHRAASEELLETLSRDRREALRIGLSGTPGVGKSTFIEAFGMMLTAQGLRVAVLAVDPSSTRTGGSILGDKTRMERLSRDPDAFIRPSPSQTHLGGVARRTRDAVALCEAAGFDVVLIETVGVGQSETIVAEMSDLFVLLIAPAGGDELQGVKRGIMETADLILVNKADGDLKAAATRTAADYSGALRLLRRREGDAPGFPKVLTVSALENRGLAGAWAEMQTLADFRRETGAWGDRRARQATGWFEDEVRQGLLARLRDDPSADIAMTELGREVSRGDRSPSAAAAEILRRLKDT